MSKVKSKINPRKVMEGKIHQLGEGLGDLYGRLDTIQKHLIGLESLVMHYADFSGNRAEFEVFLDKMIKEVEEAEKAKEAEKTKEVEKEGAK